MPLTRHLYEIDEVVSALQTCLRNGWGRSPFWLWELIRSDEYDLAYDTLIDTWLRYGGGYDPTILTAPHATDEDWCHLRERVFNALRRAKTMTAERFLNEVADMGDYPTPTAERATRTPAIQSDRIEGFLVLLEETEELTAEEGRHLWCVMEVACRHRRIEAMWLLQAIQPILSADTIWTFLESLWPALPTYIRSTATADPIRQLLHQATVVLLLCMTAEERIVALEPAEAKPWYEIREWGRWDQNLGHRAARREEIPPAALHAGTTRGSTPFRYTNIADVRDPVVLLTEGCRWWRAALESAGITEDADTGAVVFPDDDVLEAFYVRHFPDDIPDEWSTKDQQKSHGRGCAETAPPAPSIVLRENRVSDAAWIAGIQMG